MKPMSDVKTELIAWRDKHADELKNKGIAQIEANFDGSGDEGDLRHLIALPSVEPGAWDPVPLDSAVENELREIIEQLDNSDYDGDGGGTDVTFVVATGALKRTEYSYVTDREYGPAEEV